MNDEMDRPPVEAPRRRRDFLDVKLPASFETAPPSELAADILPPEQDTLVPITVRLQPRHAQYVRQIGELRGLSMEKALETIVREHKHRDLSLIQAGPGIAVPAR
jgi:hypothetical protein